MATGTNYLDRIDAFFRSHGFTAEGASAVEGNIQVETGGTFSPKTWNPHEHARGIFQEERSRLAALKAFAAARGKSPRNLMVQLQFGLYEMRQRGLVAKINTAPTVAAGAQIVQHDFEGSDPATLAERQRDAQMIFQRSAQPGAAVGPTGPATGGVVALAESQLGKPYAWDRPLLVRTKKPKRFDCSGLVEWCYWWAGVRPGLPHNAAMQFAVMKHRPLAQAQPGDAVFFGPARIGHLAYHVAIYAGNNEIIEAPDYGIPVRKRALTPKETGLVKKVGYLRGSSSAAVASSSSSAGAGAQTVAATSTLGSGIATTGLSWSSVLPWNWGDAASTIIQDVITLVIKVLFAAGGVGLIILGINRAAKASSP